MNTGAPGGKVDEVVAVTAGADNLAGASLAELREEAAREDAPPAAAPAPGADDEDPGKAIDALAEGLKDSDTVEDWEGAIDLGLDFFSDDYPGLARVYTEQRRRRLAAAIHRVAVKHGWSVGGLLFKWKEEATLLLVALPIVRETKKVLAAGPQSPAPAPPAAKPAARTAAHDAEEVGGAIRANE